MSRSLTVSLTPPSRRSRRTACLVLPVWQDGEGPSIADELTASAPVARALAASGHDGSQGRRAVVHTGDPDLPGTLVLVGMGRRDGADADALRRLGGVAGTRAADEPQSPVAVHVPDVPAVDPDVVVYTIAEGVGLGGYRFDQYRTSPEPPKRASGVSLWVSSAPAALKRAIERGRVVAAGVNLSREIGDLPPNDLGPVELASRIRAEARAAKLTCRVLEEPTLRRENMNALLAVARGSARPARMAVLEHRPRGARRRPIVFVGKAITFDTGGISLKSREGMEAMKYDLGGGSAVVGALTAIARLGLRRPVVGLVPIAENMPDGSAARPGDIVTTASGLTVEILNTDAEGRLILADALHYARRYDPEFVVDAATLTGAIVVALGNAYAGCFSRDPEMAERVRAAGGAVGERFWPMPVDDAYAEVMRGEVADLRNSGGRAGGACLAAAFLEKFTDYPWAHLDIAGVGNASTPSDLQRKGATGFGVRTMIELARS